MLTSIPSFFLQLAGITIYRKIFKKQRALIEEDKQLLEAARNAVDRHLRSQFSSGDETLLEVLENPDDEDDPGARLKFPVVPDERTQEDLKLVVAQLERERDQHTSFVDTSANSCFGLLTQWQIEYVTTCHKRWNLVRRNTGAHANDGAMAIMNFCKRWIRCMLNSNQGMAAKAGFVDGFLHFIEEMLPHLQRYYEFRWAAKTRFFGRGRDNMRQQTESLHVKFAILYEDMLNAKIRLQESLTMPSLKEKLHQICIGIKRSIYNGGNKKALLGFLFHYITCENSARKLVKGRKKTLQQARVYCLCRRAKYGGRKCVWGG